METSFIQAQLSEAATLMLTGMIIVFVFLTILIFSVKLLTAFCLSLPQPQEDAIEPRVRVASAPNALQEAQVNAAIQAAVDAYRRGETST